MFLLFLLFVFINNSYIIRLILYIVNTYCAYCQLLCVLVCYNTEVLISDWLTNNTKKLEGTGVATARLDCLVLLEDATGKDRAYLLAHPEALVRGPSYHKLNGQVERRLKHEPLAYIRGKTEFYGREFTINKHVLEPRPESETMIELTLKVIGDRLKVSDNIRVIDVGTGSGALAITMKLEVPKIDIVGTDISKSCIHIANKNAEKFGVNVQFFQGNLLEPIYNLEPVTYNLLLANLPYVPDSHTINKAAMQEPKIAIFGGPDGLDLYRQLFLQIATKSQFAGSKCFVFTESLPPQHPSLAKIAKNHGYKQLKEDDFIQCFARL